MQLFLSLVFGYLIVSFVAGSEDPNQIHRLPKTVLPKHYDLQLITNSHEGNVTFRGSVKILLDVLEGTAEIVLHSVALTVSNVSLCDGDGIILENLMVESDEPRQFVVVRGDKEFQAGSYILCLEFQRATTENTSEDGIYVSPYGEDIEIDRRHYLASQFGPTHARTVFPCFDEPFFKASFSLKITHHKSQTADSNMPLDGHPTQSQDDADFVVSTFQRTPKMSTYLLAFVVSDLIQSSATNHTIKASPDAINETSYALQMAKGILTALDQCTAIPYSSFMPKLTHMLVPGWLHQGRNWGLVVYSDRNLRFNEHAGDSTGQRIVMSQVAHQLAHMWFGNLVTAKWWDSVWISEGLALLYSTYALQLVHPSEHWMEWFRMLITSELMHGSPGDSITRECQTKGDIEMVFSSKAHIRAAAVLDMFRQIVSDDKWQLAIRNILRKHQFSTIGADDLYRKIEDVVDGMDLFSENRTVRRTFESWMTIEGTPMLVIERLYGEGRIKISQYRMKPAIEIGNESWVIPFDYAYKSSANFDHIGPIHWLTEPSVIIDTVAAANEWVVFNKRQFGFYRINYDSRNWRMIAQALRSNISCMHRMNRAQLLNDAFHFLDCGQLDKNTSFEMITFLGNETESVVWFAAFPIMRYIEWEIGGVIYHNYYKIFVHHLTERYYDSIPFKSASSTHERTMRRLTSYLACRAGNEKCLNTTRLAFETAYRSNSTVMPVDEAAIVFCFGLRGASNEEFHWYMDQFELSGNPRRLIDTVGCVNRSDHLQEVIERVHNLIQEATFHEQYYLQPRFVQGLSSEMGEAQFWRISQLLHNQTLVDLVNSTVLLPLMGVMNSRVYSAEAAAVMKEQYQALQAKYSHLWSVPGGDYKQSWNIAEYSMNGLVENYVRSVGLI